MDYSQLTNALIKPLIDSVCSRVIRFDIILTFGGTHLVILLDIKGAIDNYVFVKKWELTFFRQKSQKIGGIIYGHGQLLRNWAACQANPPDQLTHIEFYKNIHPKCFAEWKCNNVVAKKNFTNVVIIKQKSGQVSSYLTLAALVQ